MLIKPSIYIETTVLSYLAARPARDVVTLARQEMSREFWMWAPSEYILFASELTRVEISRGDAIAAKRRQEYFQQCQLLADIPETLELARQLISIKAIPETDPEDALHIAIATLAQMKYIVSWNFSHMVGPQAKRQLEKAISSLGFVSPMLATPEEIFEEQTS